MWAGRGNHYRLRRPPSHAKLISDTSSSPSSSRSCGMMASSDYGAERRPRWLGVYHTHSAQLEQALRS